MIWRNPYALYFWINCSCWPTDLWQRCSEHQKTQKSRTFVVVVQKSRSECCVYTFCSNLCKDFEQMGWEQQLGRRLSLHSVFMRDARASFWVALARTAATSMRKGLEKGTADLLESAYQRMRHGNERKSSSHQCFGEWVWRVLGEKSRIHWHSYGNTLGHKRKAGILRWQQKATRVCVAGCRARLYFGVAANARTSSSPTLASFICALYVFLNMCAWTQNVSVRVYCVTYQRQFFWLF